MKKTLLSLGILGILCLGTSNVFAAPMPPQSHAKNPPGIEKHQPQPQKHHVAPKKSHIAPPPPKHVAHKPHKHIAQQPYYSNYGYTQGFALKIGNFFLSI